MCDLKKTKVKVKKDLKVMFLNNLMEKLQLSSERSSKRMWISIKMFIYI